MHAEMAAPVFRSLRAFAKGLEVDEHGLRIMEEFIEIMVGYEVTSSAGLKALLQEGSEELVRATFPEKVDQLDGLVALLGAFEGELTDLIAGEVRADRRAHDAGLSWSLLALEMEKKKAKVDKDVKEYDVTGAGLLNTRRATRWAQTAGPTSLGASENAIYEKWVSKAVAFLVAGDVPSVRIAGEAENPEVARSALIGAARAATVRLRVRVWGAFARWLEWHRGYSWPQRITDLIDYVAHVCGEAPTATFPRSFAAAVGWFEARSALPSEARFADNEQFRLMIEKVLVEVNVNTGEVVRAPRFPVSVVVAMEVAVMTEEIADGLRVLLWARLLKVFGVMRMDDLRRVARGDLVLGDGGLAGTLRRTKTSGPGKKVRVMHFFVPAEAALTGLPWLQTGFRLWEALVPEGLDHFLPRMTGGRDAFTRKVATGADLAAMGRAALLALRVPTFVDGVWGMTDEKLATERMLIMLTGHSERPTLPSLAAILGVPKADRDYLGRWTAEGSDEYVRTARRVVKTTVHSIIAMVSAKGAYEVTEEPDAYEKLEVKMVKAGLDPVKAKEETDLAKTQAKKIFEHLARFVEEKADKDEEVKYAGAPGQALEQLPAAEDPGEIQKDEHDETKALFVISVARRNRPARTVSTLHSCSGCYRGRQLAFANYELVFDPVPPRAAYTEVCRTCWPAGPPHFDTEAKAGTEENDLSSSLSSASS